MEHSILIVDDDLAIKQSVEEYLKLMSYDVRSAGNALEAIEILKIFKADVVLTDIMMQGMDGLELTRLIKEGYAGQLLPSCECYMKIMYKRYGGYGYSHVLETILPVLKNAYGVSQKDIDIMMRENPKKYLAYEA